MKQFFVFILMCSILMGCVDRKKTAERTISVNGIDILVRAISAKDMEAGITGTPHAPIILPYIKSEKSLVITLELKGWPLVVAESHANMEEFLSGSDLDETLEGIEIQLSSSKEHLLYERKHEPVNSRFVFHRVGDSTTFFTIRPDNEELVLNKLPSPLKVAEGILADTAYNLDKFGGLVEALVQSKDISEIDYVAIRNWDHNPTARRLVGQRTYWKHVSPEWKEGIDNIFKSCTEKYTDEYIKTKNPFSQIKALCELGEQTREPNFIITAHKLLMKGVAYDGQYCSTLSMERSRYESDTIGVIEAMQTNYEKEVDRKLKQDANTFVAERYLNCGLFRYDSAAMGKCLSVLADNWPEDSIARENVGRRSTLVPKNKIPALKKAAETQLGSSYEKNAKYILSCFCTCEEIKALEKKHKTELWGPPGCK